MNQHLNFEATCKSIHNEVVQAWEEDTIPTRDELFELEDLDTVPIQEYYLGKRFDEVEFETKDCCIWLMPFVYFSDKACLYYLGGLLLYHCEMEGPYFEIATVSFITLMDDEDGKLGRMISLASDGQLRCLLKVIDLFLEYLDYFSIYKDEQLETMLASSNKIKRQLALRND